MMILISNFFFIIRYNLNDSRKHNIPMIDHTSWCSITQECLTFLGQL